MKTFLKAVYSLIFLLAVCFPATGFGAPKYRVIIIPKLVGIGYYDAVKQGVDDAAKELPEMQVIWSGPTQDQVEKQIEMNEKLIPTHPDLIAVAANDPVAIAPVMKKAHDAGIRVMSWDADSKFREFFVNLVDFTDFGTQIVEEMKDEIGPKGEIAIITTTFTAPNQSSWIEAMKKHIYANYPAMKILDVRPAGESTEEAYRITQDYLKTFPNLKGIIVVGAPNLPGAAKAVKEAGLAGKIAVVGNSTPNMMRAYIKDGTVKKFFLWNAPDHGYLTVYSAYQMLTGELKPGIPFKAGRLGVFTPKTDTLNLQIALPVMVFTKENIDQYHF